MRFRRLQFARRRRNFSSGSSPVTANSLFRQGVPPHATYLFKHALVEDAGRMACYCASRAGRCTLIAETLRVNSQRLQS